MQGPAPASQPRPRARPTGAQRPRSHNSLGRLVLDREHLRGSGRGSRSVRSGCGTVADVQLTGEVHPARVETAVSPRAGERRRRAFALLAIESERTSGSGRSTSGVSETSEVGSCRAPDWGRHHNGCPSNIHATPHVKQRTALRSVKSMALGGPTSVRRRRRSHHGKLVDVDEIGGCEDEHLAHHVRVLFVALMKPITRRPVARSVTVSQRSGSALGTRSAAESPRRRARLRVTAMVAACSQVW
jgi:hypothetical protein